MNQRWKRWLPGGRNQMRGDITEELRAHVEELAQENRRSGMSEEEARRAAVLRFGNLGALSDSCQQERQVFRLEELAKDLRFGLRILRSSPAFTLIAVLTLALGIGGTTAIFSVVHNVLLKPLPIRDPGRVLVMWSVWKDQNGTVSAGNYVDWREQSQTIENMSAQDFTNFTVEGTDNPERLTGALVTPNYFSLYGVPPLLGRTFTEEEDQPGRDTGVVISESLWKKRFHSDRNALGREIKLNGRVYNIVGVMPDSFDPVLNHEQVWAPLAWTAKQRAYHDSHSFLVVGRLKPGVTLAQARAEMHKIAKVQQERFPEDNHVFGDREIALQPLEDVLFADARDSMYMLLGAVGFVLIIACVNVGTLQLARARARRKEIAIRSALGASAARIVRQLLAESLLLSCLGGLLGLGVAQAVLQLIVARAPASIPRIETASLDGWALLCSLISVFFAAVLSGGWAAARARKTDPNEELASGRTSGVAVTRDRLRGAMVISEVSLAVMLLVGAALLIRSAIAVNQTELGFDASHLLVGRVTLPEANYRTPQSLRTTLGRIVEAAAHIPGVRSAALVNRTPMVPATSNGLEPEGRASGTMIEADFRIITPQYLETLGIPLKTGRIFGDGDTPTSPKVMIINEKLAQLAFPGEDPLGKRIKCCDETEKVVVGVVGNIRAHGLTADIRPEFYLPLQQAPDAAWEWVGRTMEVVVKTSGAPAAAGADLRSLMKQIDPAVPVYRISSMEERIGATLQERRFITFLLTSFAALAVFLAGIGIYGVVSFQVTQRTQEIGIRMALGAKRAQVMRLILGHALGVVAVGTVIGVAGAFVVTRSLSSLLYRVAPTDPVSFVAAPALLFGLALLASYIPAAKAVRIDPIVALR